MARPWEQHYPEPAKHFDLNAMFCQRLGDLAPKAAEEFGDRPAMTTILPTGAQTTVTYAEAARAVDAFAVYLREVLKLDAGDVVALMTPNCIGFGIVSLGVARAGCTLTNVNPLYTVPELEHQLQDSGAKVLAIIDLFGDKADQVVPKTGVKHVVTLSLVDFFPPVKKAILGFALKRVRKMVPAMATPHVPLARALAEGRSAARGIDIAAYTEHVTPSDTILLQYTSGTTGRSKGAELTHTGILANAYQGKLMTDELRPAEPVTTLIILPLYHITAFALMFVAGVSTGGHGVMVPSPRPLTNLKAAFEKHRITWFIGINTLYAALLNEKWFTSEMFANVACASSGGAAQQAGVARKWEERTGVPIRQGYGMTECCGVLATNSSSENRLGTVGIPVPGMDVRIVDDAGQDVPQGERGEIIFKGPTIMKGYLNRPDATAETIRAGWLHSGDIAVMDADGYITIVDRKKDMILVSGFNVSPNEIEDVISHVPGVVQVGVIGVPDDRSGEVPAAFIVRTDDSLTEQAVLDACHKSLTNYKVPKRVEFVDEVPVTLSGKVLRRELRARVTG
jgi:long-chain acyl-CoA synthetase